ncbi:hypothetical protein K470DRAFT_2280 [Piedraia hortae CBS 480.64]|uniref:Uncharacterized protein n=1 Tax=Piedraia hortae CBS 480.64 TaxID=1314780 RepID=A0A6A7CAX9_9PEZI|nr:hypothetical protein K470DRAFT_2280 [Piedraia hortae CBS 480.64]
MDRMGKVQESRRNFSFLPTLGFVSLIQGTWEGLLVSNYPGLLNGGRAGLFWCTIAVWILTNGSSASMAQMASTAPTAGGQCHDVLRHWKRDFWMRNACDLFVRPCFDLLHPTANSLLRFAITDVEKQIMNAENKVLVLFIIHSATNSKTGTCILGTVSIILCFFCTLTNVASSSRQVWASSRDHGLPYASVIRQVHPEWETPLKAHLICLAISLLLGAIHFGSNVASFIFVASFILTITYYFISGRHHYVPPVRLVKTE